jgi:hypothetical protein
MALEVVITLCEGPHDVAFLNRILKTVGFRSNDKSKIGEFPFPINRLVPAELMKSRFEELNLIEVRTNLIPTNSLIREQKFVFLYSLGGDAKRESRIRILRQLDSLLPEDGEISDESLPDNFELSIIYFFDADRIGVQRRLQEINSEIIEAFNFNEQLLESNGTFIKLPKIKIGSFVFTGDDNESGKLEDVIVPIMQKGNEGIFSSATEYLNGFYDEERLYPLKLSILEGQIVEQRSNKNGDKQRFDKSKSLIAVTGQLQRSGTSNIVCIGHADYLTLEKIRSSEKCQEIIAFFEGFLK